MPRSRSLRTRFRKVRRRAQRAFRKASLSVQLSVVALALLLLWATLNGVYQVVRKPTELFFPVSSALDKSPAETWRQYAPIFRAHSTAVLTPELLAALAQLEGSGNPVARTYWRWQLDTNPFELYRPASSAVGMYQIIDGTFVEAKRYCIRDHVVVEAGPWHDLGTCWFNGLYSRVIPSHAVELTSAFLQRKVTTTLERQRIRVATLRQKQDLAGVIHLCGAGAGGGFAKRGFTTGRGQLCGDHDVARYLARLRALQRLFAILAVEQA